MDDPEKRRWYCPAPAWLVYGSLAVTGLLWLSNWLGSWHKGYAVLVAVAGVGMALVAMLLWCVVAMVFRWPFQFGIRTLLVLTAVVAWPFSWLAVNMKRAREQKESVAVGRLDGFVGYAWAYDNHTPDGKWLSNAQPPEPAWLRNLLGDDFFSDVVFLCILHATDSDLAQLKRLKHLQGLALDHTQITDVGLTHIAELAQLRQVSLLNCTRIYQ
jgi:hypothetical protein